MKDEEVVLLEEQLSAAQTDIDRLQEQLAEATARATTSEAEGTEMRKHLALARREIAERDSERTAQVAEVESLRSAIATAEDRARSAAGRYRESALALDPSLPAELVGGDSVESIDAALEQARQTVAQVRQQLEQAAA